MVFIKRKRIWRNFHWLHLSTSVLSWKPDFLFQKEKALPMDRVLSHSVPRQQAEVEDQYHCKHSTLQHMSHTLFRRKSQGWVRQEKQEEWLQSFACFLLKSGKQRCEVDLLRLSGRRLYLLTLVFSMINYM